MDPNGDGDEEVGTPDAIPIVYYTPRFFYSKNGFRDLRYGRLINHPVGRGDSDRLGATRVPTISRTVVNISAPLPWIAHSPCCGLLGMLMSMSLVWRLSMLWGGITGLRFPARALAREGFRDAIAALMKAHVTFEVG